MITANITLPNILIIGPSGTGKSTSLRKLNPTTTGVLNKEQKQLPFPQAKDFIHNKMCATQGDVTTELLMGLGMNPAIDNIILESFTSIDESILSYCRKTYTGWDIFFHHNRMVRELIETTKTLSFPRPKIGPKFVVVIGHDEIINIPQPNGSSKAVRRLKVDGKELSGTLEKEFTIVLFTEVIEEVIAGVPYMRYKFLTNYDGVCSAKTPMGMFKEKYIDNDLNMVINRIKEYYEIK